MTVLVKFQIEIRFSIELYGNSKLSMTSCPPPGGGGGGTDLERGYGDVRP